MTDKGKFIHQPLIGIKGKFTLNIVFLIKLSFKAYNLKIYISIGNLKPLNLLSDCMFL